jgi:transcriptional regulator with XRE-family HTH domain
MTTEKETKHPAKPTGRRYSSVKDMMAAEGVAKEVQAKVQEMTAETHLVHQLSRVRQKAGLTQEAMAEFLGVTQSAVSKLETGLDAELTVAQIKQYAKATNERISLYFGKPLTHVEAVKMCAQAIRHHLTCLASIARGDEELEKSIQGFFGEAFFNLLDILTKCHQQLPGGSNIEVRMEIGSLATQKKARLSCPDSETIQV